MTNEEKLEKAEQILKGVFQRLNIAWQPKNASIEEILKVELLLKFLTLADAGVAALGEDKIVEMFRAMADMIELSTKEMKWLGRN